MTAFLVPLFFILHSLFLPTPARAQSCDRTCSADAPYEIVPCGVTCGDVLFLYGNNYRLCATDPTFPAPALGSRNGSWYYDKATFPSGTVLYNGVTFTVPNGGVYLCDSNVFGCANPACSDQPPDGEDCHMPDKNLTTCCPVKNSASSLLEQLRNMVLDIELPFSLTVRNFKVSKKFEEATDYYFGQTKTNGDGKEEIEEGVFFRLAPPNLLEEYFPNEGGEVSKRKDWAKWIVGTTDRSGGSGDDALNDGKLKHVEPYAFAAENLRNFLVAIPKPENTTTSQKLPTTALASYPSTTSNPKNSVQVLGATAADSCNLPLVEAETKKTCTPPDAPGKKATVGDLLELLGGGLGLFPKIADLDKIGHYTTGIETDEEGWVKKEDQHYSDGGFLEIFKLPTDPKYEDQNAKGSADLAFQVSVLPTINIGGEELKIRHQGSDTEAREKEDGVYAKLTVPQAENGTTLLRHPTSPRLRGASDYGGPAAAVLASTKTPLVDSSTPLNPLTPLNLSLAERVGRTLGTWLGRLITL